MILGNFDSFKFISHSGLKYKCYRKLSNIRRIKYQNLNDSRLILHLTLPNLSKSGIK